MIVQVAAAARGYGYGGRRRVWEKRAARAASPLTEFGVVQVGLGGMLGGERGVDGVR